MSEIKDHGNGDYEDNSSESSNLNLRSSSNPSGASVTPSAAVSGAFDVDDSPDAGEGLYIRYLVGTLALGVCSLVCYALSVGGVVGACFCAIYLSIRVSPFFAFLSIIVLVLGILTLISSLCFCICCAACCLIFVFHSISKKRSSDKIRDSTESNKKDRENYVRVQSPSQSGGPSPVNSQTASPAKPENHDEIASEEIELTPTESDESEEPKTDSILPINDEEADEESELSLTPPGPGFRGFEFVGPLNVEEEDPMIVQMQREGLVVDDIVLTSSSTPDDRESDQYYEKEARRKEKELEELDCKKVSDDSDEVL